jgi:hypothetical protein
MSCDEGWIIGAIGTIEVRREWTERVAGTLDFEDFCLCMRVCVCVCVCVSICMCL